MAASRSQDRIELCVSECAEKAWRLAYGLMRNRADAEDVLQQSFLVAASKPDRIPNEDCWKWFATVLTFEARNAWRKRASHRDTSATPPDC